MQGNPYIMTKYVAYALAATLLATSAHAYPVGEWQCGNISVNISSPAGRGGPETTTVTITGPHGFTFNKGRVGHNFNFRFKAEGPFKDAQMPEYIGYTGGKVYLNGKRCKDYVEEADSTG
jgi:hypothetical protein